MKSPDGRQCSKFLKHRRIALKGRRTTTVYFLNNDEREVERIEVDGCAITEGVRCDWLLRLDDAASKEEIYVELKGRGVPHAIEQLRGSIDRLSADKRLHPKRAIIVFTRNPMSGTDIQIQQAKFLKDFRAILSMVKDKATLPL
jgi:hypothetical protein